MIRPYLQIFFHDSNFQAFDHVLTAEQGSGIFHFLLRAVEMVYIGLLALFQPTLDSRSLVFTFYI